MEEYQRCSMCDGVNSLNARFCKFCGSALQATPPIIQPVEVQPVSPGMPAPITPAAMPGVVLNQPGINQVEEMTFFETRGEGVLMRWGAVWVDGIFISILYFAGLVGYLAIAGGLSVILSASRPESAWNALAAAVPLGALILYPILWFLYYLIFEGAWGATPGKFIGMRPVVLKVIRKDDQPCGFGRAALRAILGVFEQNIIGAIVVASTPLKQRIGDILAGTLVVDVTKFRRVVFAPDAVTFEYVGGRKVEVVHVTRGVLTKWLGKVQHMTFYGLDRAGREVKIKARMTTGATVFGQMEAMHDLRKRLEQRFNFQCQEKLEWWRIVVMVLALLMLLFMFLCVMSTSAGSNIRFR